MPTFLNFGEFRLKEPLLCHSSVAVLFIWVSRSNLKKMLAVVA
jgi:hypothetical protein